MHCVKQLVIAALLLLGGAVRAQQLSLGNTPYMMNKSAVLELNASNQGLLLPRLTDTAGINALNPPDGMVIYFTPARQFLLRANGYWNALSSSATAASQWTVSGNNNIHGGMHFLGTTNNASLRFRTNDRQRMMIDSNGYVGVGLADPGSYLAVRDSIEIRRVGAMASLLFSNTSGTGDFRIGSSGGDLFWQGGGGRALQMGSYWGMVLAGDRQAAGFPALVNGAAGTGVLIPAQRVGSVPLAVQGMAGQTANLTEWRNATATVAMMNNAGSLALGINTFDAANPEKLLINGGVTTSYNLIKGRASINNYLQLNLQNLSNGAAASTDIVATADNGTETSNYVNLGINGSGYTSGYFGDANDAYLYSLGQDFLIGNGTAGKNLRFLTGGSAKAANTRMIIDGSGNVAIGTTTFDADSPEKLLVDAGSSTYTPIMAQGNYNGYFQINVRNSSTGNQASSDLVATANNGTETTNFINVGINGSNYVYQSGNPIETGKANDGYLLSSGNDLYIVNNNPSKDIIFLAGGTATVNEAMRITANERVGIGTTAPNAATKLDVNGAVKVGASGTVVKNIITASATFNTSANIGGATFTGFVNSISPTHLDITYTLPASNALTSVQATVSVSPGSDLPNGVSIAYARAVSTTSIRIRFMNNGTAGQTIAAGTKLYLTITDF